MSIEYHYYTPLLLLPSNVISVTIFQLQFRLVTEFFKFSVTL